MKRTISPRQTLLYLVVGLTLLTLLAWGGWVNAIEDELTTFIYRLLQPLRTFLLFMTQLGSVSMLFVAIAVSALARQFRVAAELAIGGGLALVATILLKELVARPRPFDVLEAVGRQDMLADGFGYPSGHTAIITVIGPTLYAILPARFRYIVWVVIGTVALSRIALGVHSLLDIIGGMVIGIMAVLIARRLVSMQNAKNS